jgi:putative membrane protein
MEMEEERSYTFHYLLRAAIMLGITLYIVYLVKSDRLLYYIAPRMMLYVKIAALLLFIIAVYQIYMVVRTKIDENEENCGCEHVPSRSVFLNIIIYSLFLFPLLLGFLLPDTVMGSDVASIKGMNLSANNLVKTSKPVVTAAKANNSQGTAALPEAASTANTTGGSADNTSAADKTGNATKPGNTKLSPEDAKLQKLFVADEYTEDYAKLGMKLYKKDTITIKEVGFMELLTAVDLYMDNFVGKKMVISGFIYREDDMAPNQFVVSRLAMQCCSADASPYGVMVESARSKDFPKDTWVTITGTIGKTTYNKNTILKLDALKIEKIKASATPYVYPYFDDFSNLIK